MVPYQTYKNLEEAAEENRATGTSAQSVSNAFDAVRKSASSKQKLSQEKQKKVIDAAVNKLNREGGSIKGYSKGAYGQRQTILKRARSVSDAPGMKKAETKKQAIAAKRIGISSLSNAKKTDHHALSGEDASISGGGTQSAVLSLSSLNRAPDSPRISLGAPK